MSVTLLMSALMATQSAVYAAPVPLPDEREALEVSYDAVSAGSADHAIAQLQESLEKNPDDPATLINLAAALLQKGDTARAEAAYRAAIRSDVRYRLELADGTWIDSRRAAQRGLEGIEGHTLAAR